MLPFLAISLSMPVSLRLPYRRSTFDLLRFRMPFLRQHSYLSLHRLSFFEIQYRYYAVVFATYLDLLCLGHSMTVYDSRQYFAFFFAFDDCL
jgi:hypothetical protein